MLLRLSDLMPRMSKARVSKVRFNGSGSLHRRCSKARSRAGFPREATMSSVVRPRNHNPPVVHLPVK
jgi:hypothetical protein